MTRKVRESIVFRWMVEKDDTVVELHAMVSPEGVTGQWVVDRVVSQPLEVSWNADGSASIQIPRRLPSRLATALALRLYKYL